MTKTFLVATAQDAKSAEGMGVPCGFLFYRIGEAGTLQRAQLPASARGGLMGIYEAPGLAAADLSRLVRDISAECARRGYGGAILDFELTQEGVPAFSQLCAGLIKQNIPVFVPQALASAAPGCKVILPSAVSGGSFEEMLDRFIAQYGAEQICLDVMRSCNDFTMPSYTPDGTVLSLPQFQEIQQRYQPSAYFSQELCAKYFTYRPDRETVHFVLYDDPDTGAQKIRVATQKGLYACFLLYREWGTNVKSMLGR